MRSYHHRDFDPARVAAAKAGRTASVCIPARNEEATVGEIVERILRDLGGLVDEVVVVDDNSTDGTGKAAAGAGARVVRREGAPGKGRALRTATEAAAGDVVVFCDADIRDFDTSFVVGLLGPLLTDDGTLFVKAFYERPLDEQPRGGGRVTELVARPLLALLFPHLADVVQPLAGEYGGRRDVLVGLTFAEGYGVDIGVLIDVAAAVGVDAMVQVDLGVRVHRNRPLDELGPMAGEVLAAALRRAGVAVPDDATLTPPGFPPVPLLLTER